MAVIPTKGNLMALQRSLSLAGLGYELMDRKRNILIREMMNLIDRAADIQSKIDSTFHEAYLALQAAQITLGNCDVFAQLVPLDDSLHIRFRSVMGVELPTLSMDESEPSIHYGFSMTNSMLDRAARHFYHVKKLTLALAEVETSIYRLAFAIKKTQKRANALQNIIIPNLEHDVKFISDALEEKEREEYFRLKVIKRKTV